MNFQGECHSGIRSGKGNCKIHDLPRHFIVRYCLEYFKNNRPAKMRDGCFSWRLCLHHFNKFIEHALLVGGQTFPSAEQALLLLGQFDQITLGEKLRQRDALIIPDFRKPYHDIIFASAKVVVKAVIFLVQCFICADIFLAGRVDGGTPTAHFVSGSQHTVIHFRGCCAINSAADGRTLACLHDGQGLIEHIRINLHEQRIFQRNAAADPDFSDKGAYCRPRQSAQFYIVSKAPEFVRALPFPKAHARWRNRVSFRIRGRDLSTVEYSYITPLIFKSLRKLFLQQHFPISVR